MSVRRVSVSTWAVHSLIRSVGVGRPGDPAAQMMSSGGDALDLLEVPGELAKHGYKTMELCHFHIPHQDDAYLAELKQAIDEAGVELWSLLIDDGNITDPEHHDRDREWTADWITRAGKLGSKCVRVIGGKQQGATKLAIEQLGKLASQDNVRVLTENWFETLATPAAIHEVFAQLDGRIGLCFDFGNWGGPTKYRDLDLIARYATSCHAKCQYTNGVPDEEDFRRCLEITKAADFSGPYTLVYGEPGKVWESLDRQRQLLEPYL